MNASPLKVFIKSQPLSVMAESTDNNLNLIRILCAWGVLIAHSYVLAGATENITDPFSYYFNIGMGTFFVVVFFAISGFLIQRSMLKSSSLMSYCQARFLRLVPALTVVLILSVLVLGPMVTKLSWQDYFSELQTWRYFYNLNLLDINTQFTLPGVFQEISYPNAVNGSIWTLPFETWMYVMTATFYCIQQIIVFKYPTFKTALRHLTLISVSLLLIYAGHYFQHSEKNQHYDILLFVSTFFIGANFYNLRKHIHLNWWVMTLLLAGIPWLKSSLIAPLYLPATIVYSVLTLAYLPQGFIRKYNALGDYSYGLYIYAFPVQQSLSYWLEPGFIMMIILSTAITLPLAILSWHFIESPALRLKPNRQRINSIPLSG